jgi:hypothetical protein
MLSAAELAAMTATVGAFLDVSLPLYRKTTALDGSGHTTVTYPGTPTATVQVNVIKPSATQLQAFAGIIGSQKALLLRFLQTTDIREGDRIVYSSLNWLVQHILNAESYTVANEALITTIT